MLSTSRLCIRCFQPETHERSDCTENAVVCCSSCYRMNYLTRDCCHAITNKADDEYPQTFRKVSHMGKQYFFIDVQIGSKYIAGRVNTNLSTTKMDESLRSILGANTESIPIKTRKGTFQQTCSYEKLPKPIRIELGMDFISKQDFNIILDGLCLSATDKGRPAHNKEARYTIDVKICWQSFIAVIDTSLQKSEITKSVLRGFSLNQFLFTYDRTMVQVFLEWKGRVYEKLLNIVPDDEGHRIRLGHDFLAVHKVQLRHEGIRCDLNNPWTTEHPDQIKFAYNHVMGRTLREHLLKMNHDLETDMMRPTVTAVTTAVTKPIPTEKAKRD